MRKILIAMAAFVLISARLLSDIYESLHITQDEAKKCLLLSIGNGFVQYDGHSSLLSDARNLSDGAKVEGVRELIRLAKTYSATEEFRNDYKKWRNKQLNGDTKGKLGIPKFGKMLDKAIDNQLDKKDNDKRYPADPEVLIKNRLTEFLNVSANVDYDAQLTESRMFVKPEYEKKSAYWKMCYRAGKEVVEAAREEARKWLDELNSK